METSTITPEEVQTLQVLSTIDKGRLLYTIKKQRWNTLHLKTASTAVHLEKQASIERWITVHLEEQNQSRNPTEVDYCMS